MATITSQQMIGGLPSSLLRRPADLPRRLEITTVERRRPIVTARVEAAARVLPAAQLLVDVEGEDAKITGGTRSLRRRLLALNLDGTMRRTVVRALPGALSEAAVLNA